MKKLVAAALAAAIVLAVAVGLAGLAAGCRQGPAADQAGVKSVPKGQSLYTVDFSAVALDGRTVSTRELRGQVVLLNFFATWCAPCHKETPHLVDLHQKLHDKGLTVVMVSEEPSEVVQPFATSLSVPFAVIADGGAVQRQVKELRGYPTSVILDKEGRVRYEIAGANLDVIDRALTALLSE